MPKLRVHNIAISLDGYGAGPNQDADNPLGCAAPNCTSARFGPARSGRCSAWRAASKASTTGSPRREKPASGATVMGRNMFGHHPREPIAMQGGTTFHFVTDGIHAAVERAVDAADGKDVRLGGGVAAIQQYLHAGLLDEMHLVIVPVLLGRGERLFDNLARS